MVAKMAITAIVVLETDTRALPQTGGGILDHQLLQDLWQGNRQRAGIPFDWAISRPRVCRFPVGGYGRSLMVCGRRTPEHKPYCKACLKLAYYRPED